MLDDIDHTSKVIFDVYDIDGSGTIEKEEFVKMLFNYPKGDIHKFYDEVTTDKGDLLGSSLEITQKRRGSVYNPNFMESVSNLREVIPSLGSHTYGDGIPSTADFVKKNSETKSKEVSRIVVNLDEDDIAMERRGSRGSEMSFHQAFNDSKMKDDSKLKDENSQNSAVLRNRQQTMTQKLRTNKFMPTSFSNQISVWADSIYEKYGNGNEMTLEGFRAWAINHRAFLFNFRKYFRYNIWKGFVNSKTNQFFLGYVHETPFLQEEIEIIKGLEKPVKKGYACLYVEFLMIFNHNSIFNAPARVLILKNLMITFDQPSATIEFAYKSDRYKPLKLRLAKESIWKFWKEMLEKYSR